MLVFFHIQKTAGSSIRDMCVDHFGRARSEGLYGIDSKSTSPKVREIAFPDGQDTLTGSEKAERIVQFLDREKPAFFSTHSIEPFRARLRPGTRTMSCFREPVARTVSHYNHWKQRGLISGTFEEFYESEKYCNFQAKRFSIEQMLALDFVALTEDLARSLLIINAQLGTSLYARHSNKTPWRPFKVRADALDDTTRQNIIERNQLDFELYAAAQDRFRSDFERLKCGEAAQSS